jgi:hypothetical protein
MFSDMGRLYTHLLDLNLEPGWRKVCFKVGLSDDMYNIMIP